MRGEIETRIDSIIKQIAETCESVCLKILNQQAIDCINSIDSSAKRQAFLRELRKERIDMENDIYNDYYAFCNVPTIRGFKGMLGFILSTIGLMASLFGLILYIKNSNLALHELASDNIALLLIFLSTLFLIISTYLLFREHKRIDIQNKDKWAFWIRETGDEFRKEIPFIHRAILFLALVIEGYIIALTITSFISSEISIKTAKYVSVITGLAVAFFLKQLSLDAGRDLYRLEVSRSLNKRFKEYIEFMGETISVKDALKKINPMETHAFESLPKKNFFARYSKLILSFTLFLFTGILIFIQRTSIQLNIFNEYNPETTYSAALLLLVMFLIMYVYTVWLGHKYSYASEYSEIAKFGLKNFHKVESHNRKLSEIAQRNLNAFFSTLIDILEENISSNSSNSNNMLIKKANKCLSLRGKYVFSCKED